MNKRRTRAGLPPGRRVDKPTIACAAHFRRPRGPWGRGPTAVLQIHERHEPAIRVWPGLFRPGTVHHVR